MIALSLRRQSCRKSPDACVRTSRIVFWPRGGMGDVPFRPRGVRPVGPSARMVGAYAPVILPDGSHCAMSVHVRLRGMVIEVERPGTLSLTFPGVPRSGSVVSSHSHERNRTDGRVRDAKPHDLGLQISRGFHPEVSTQASVQELRKPLGEVFRQLAAQKEAKVEEGHLLPDHVHMLCRFRRNTRCRTWSGTSRARARSIWRGRTANGSAISWGKASGRAGIS